MTMESTMELDELRQAWQTLDRRLQQQTAINLQLLTDSRMRKAKSSLRWLQAWSVLEIAFGLALAIFAATFWIAHMDSIALLVSGIALHAYGIGLVITGTVELLLALRIDYAAEVVTIQKYMTLLRQWRLRSRRWLGLSQWILWIPMVLVMLGYWLGIDLWAHSPATVLWTLGTCMVGLLATLWLLYWSPGALRKRVGDYVDDNSTGFVLKRAQGALDEIARFERE
jgi:hypothetical protein